VHPGVSVDEVVENTGFELDTSSVAVTREPDSAELQLIREVLDPGRTREREVPS